MASRLYVCRISDCEHSFFTARALVSHMSLSHVDTDGGHFLCSLDGCTNTYYNVPAYRKHVSRAHSEHWIASQLNNTRIDDNEIIMSGFYNSNDDNESLFIENNGCSFDSHVTVSSFQHELAQSIVRTKLRTREMHMLPKSVENSIFNDIHCLVDTYQFGIQEIVRDRLMSMGIDFWTDSELALVLQPDSIFELVNAPVKSNHLFRKFCRTNLNLVEPIPVFVDGQTGIGRAGLKVWAQAEYEGD